MKLKMEKVKKKRGCDFSIWQIMMEKIGGLANFHTAAENAVFSHLWKKNTVISPIFSLNSNYKGDYGNSETPFFPPLSLMEKIGNFTDIFFPLKMGVLFSLNGRKIR